MPNDIAIGPTNRIPVNNAISNKPSYLIILDLPNKTKYTTRELFLTIDKPDYINGFITVKGFYVSELCEEDIIKRFQELLTDTKKDLLCEMTLPWHRVFSIRSLVFKAK